MTVRRESRAGDERAVQERVRDIRAGLPGQLRRERVTTAALLYGSVCSLGELRARVAATLAWRFGSVRCARLIPIERAGIDIPDDALLKYDDARQLGIFSRFLIATPAYYFGARGDPWLVAEVQGTERWAVIARWPYAGSTFPDLL